MDTMAMVQMPVPRVPGARVADLLDPAAYADGRIHECYRWLRAHVPLGMAHPEGFDPFWVVTRHADILAVSRQNDIFHSGDRATTLIGRSAEAAIRTLNGGSPHLVHSLIEMDPPDHPKYRALTQAWFKAESLKPLEGQIRAVARAKVDSLAACAGSCDFVADLAESYPLRIIMQLLGVSAADERYLLRLTKEMFGAQDPDMARAVDPMDPRHRQLGSLPAVTDDFAEYFRALAADRRARPRDDLASLIANAQIDGEPISERQATGYFIILATAGHHTTAFASAGAIQVLAQHPEERARLKANPSLIPDFVNEALRWTTPAKTFMRSATVNTRLSGQTIARGDWLMLCYASGNRDEAAFEEPYRFKSDRRPNKHLSFGYGAHMCLGQHLAKLEMRILFETLLPRLASLEPDGEAQLLQSWFVNGLKTLPIRFTLA